MYDQTHTIQVSWRRLLIEFKLHSNYQFENGEMPKKADFSNNSSISRAQLLRMSIWPFHNVEELLTFNPYAKGWFPYQYTPRQFKDEIVLTIEDSKPDYSYINIKHPPNSQFPHCNKPKYNRELIRADGNPRGGSRVFISMFQNNPLLDH